MKSDWILNLQALFKSKCNEFKQFHLIFLKVSLLSQKLKNIEIIYINVSIKTVLELCYLGTLCFTPKIRDAIIGGFVSLAVILAMVSYPYIVMNVVLTN